MCIIGHLSKYDVGMNNLMRNRLVHYITNLNYVSIDANNCNKKKNVINIFTFSVIQFSIL